jgi:hypothetical protein
MIFIYLFLLAAIVLAIVYSYRHLGDIKTLLKNIEEHLKKLLTK